MASETPVYFPSIVSASSDSKFTPIPPQKGRHHPKKHQHGNDSRIQLEPLRPSTAGGGSGRMSISLSSEQVGLEAKIMDGSSTAAENISKFRDMEKKIQFYRQLASLKLRDVVTTEQSVLKTIDAVINACALALDADYAVLYSLNEATHMLSVTSCSKPDVVGFQVPLDKFSMETVLQSVHQQLTEDNNQRCSVEPVYVANLQALDKYDPDFDVDSLAGTKTNSILASVIVDENGKPIFVVEARCAQETLFSDSIFRAGMATLENIVYQYDLKQFLARTIDSYASLDAFLQNAIMQPAVQEENEEDNDENNPDALQVASDELMSGVDREADPELEDLLAEKSPNLKKLVENFLARSKSDGVCLIKFNPAKETCQVLASVALGTSEQLLDTDKLVTLFMATSASPRDTGSVNGAELVLPLLQRFIESIEKAHPLDLSDDHELRSTMPSQDDFKTLAFIPVPSSSSCAFVGLLFMSKVEQHEYDVSMLRPFVSALGLAIVMKKKNDDMHTSTMQKLKLIHLYNSHFEIETINDPSTLVNMICEIGCQTFNTSRVTLYVADPIKSELWSLSTLGSVNGLRIPYGVGIAGTVAKTKQKLIVRNAYDDPRFDRSFDIKFGFKTDSLITFPVLDKNGETLGVVQAINTHHFMDSDAHPLIAKFDERVLNVFNHMVSYALRINSSLIMFAKVQADYWANRAVMGDSKDSEDGSNAKSDVASVHSLLDISGFDESKRVPRNKWSTFAYACWVLGKFLLAGYRKRRENRIKREHSKWSVDDLKVGTTNEFAADRSRSRTASIIRAGRASSLINRWRRLALSPAVDQDEMLSDFFNPLTKSVDELKGYAFKLFEGLMLITTFRIDEAVLRCFIDTLASKYRPVAYHSFYHGFDVALNSYCLIRKTSVLNVIKEFEALSLMVAALGHDADHPGNDNQFEIDSNSPLALCYNDISVLENHHASTTFSVLKMAGCNILKDLSASARVSVRTAIVRCILATDMKHHSRLISDLAVIRDVGDFEQVTDGRQLMMNMIIHGADLSSVAHPLPISIKWVEMVCQEFADQATKSAALGIFVPPHILNLDDEVVRCRLQVNFIDYLVAPLWSAIGGILPEAKPTLEYLRANRDYFFENAGQMSARRASSMPQAK
ncbi:Camp-specific 3' [Globisporangium polare]